MPDKTFPMVITLDENDPVDIGVMVCRGMLEFFHNHMPTASVSESFGTFMVALEETMLSDAGKDHLRAGWIKYQGMGGNASDNK